MLVESSKNRLLNLLQATLEEPIAFLEGDQQYKVGPAGKSVVNLHVRNAGLYGRILAQGNLGLGEAFMENWFDIETGSLEGLLATLLKSNVEAKIRGNWSLMARIALYKLAHWRRGQWKNVQHHYDTGDDLFECFLDESMTYSCGYAHTLTDDLVQLQENKFD